jgi:hypothetical protein
VTCCQAVHTFRPRGFSPPRRFAPPEARGLVASRCRPWGSPGFRRRAWPARVASPPVPCPPELSPLAKPLPRHRGPLPSCRCRLHPVSGACSTSGPCSVRASVARHRRCRRDGPDALLGFPSWSSTSAIRPDPPGSPAHHPVVQERVAGPPSVGSRRRIAHPAQGTRPQERVTRCFHPVRPVAVRRDPKVLRSALRYARDGPVKGTGGLGPHLTTGRCRTRRRSRAAPGACS